MYLIYNHNWRNNSTVYIYKTRLASKEIFSPSNKIHREVDRAKDLSAPGFSQRGISVRTERRAFEYGSNQIAYCPLRKKENGLVMAPRRPIYTPLEHLNHVTDIQAICCGHCVTGGLYKLANLSRHRTCQVAATMETLGIGSSNFTSTC